MAKRTPLGQQVRECEKRWSNDAYMVATGELDPMEVSLVGISGRPRNAMLLYADMCALGYGVPQSLDEAREWWGRAADEGHRQAAERLRSGVYDSLLPGDETNDQKKPRTALGGKLVVGGGGGGGASR
jgi:TPR repeat protein